MFKGDSPRARARARAEAALDRCVPPGSGTGGAEITEDLERMKDRR
jgi:hypothetical protein